MIRSRLLGASALLLLLGVAACSHQVSDRKPDVAGKAIAIRVSRDARGHAVITLSATARARAGLDVTALATASAPARTLAYGRLEEDPSGSFTLTAPAAGTIEARGWPTLGAMVDSGSVVGSLVPRLAPADRLRLAARVATARGEVRADDAAVSADRWNLRRVRALNSDHKILTDSDLQQARATLTEDLARLAAARQTRALLENGMSSLGQSGNSLPLMAEQTGQVVQILATPGEAVQAGQTLLTIADLHRLLARVEIPAGEPSPPLDATARIVPISDERLSIPAVPIALGAVTDVQTDGEVRIFKLNQPTRSGSRAAGSEDLRPGLAVTAYLEDTASRSLGVVIPSAAMVFKNGRPFVYVDKGKGAFVRRAVPGDRPTHGGYFASGRAFPPGVRLVVTGAQALLSQELRSHFKAASS